jgi:hypothetical protein
VQQASQNACLDEAWEDVMTTQKTGFETELDISGVDMRFLRVVGLDVDGEILGVSESLDLGWEVGANGVFDGLQIRGNSELQLAVFSVAALALFVIGYESFRQLKSWTKTKWLAYKQVHSNSDVSCFV